MNAEQVKRSPAAPYDVVRFWFEEAGRKKWFLGGPSFDAEIRRRFSAHHAAAAAGLLDVWRAMPNGALALILLLDQISRNLFRRDPQAYAADGFCRRIAADAIRRRFDMVASPAARAFFYMPFMHSESLDDQDRCVTLFTARLPAGGNIPFAHEHRRIIARFGRFPHRNAALGRPSTPEEIAFLKHGGFSA